MTIRVTLVLVLLLSACKAPCETGTRSVLPSCSSVDGGVRLGYRPYSALSENFVDACEARIDGGALSAQVTLRTCEAGSSSGASWAECRLPSLEPGRYAVSEGTLVIPSDGGIATCE